MAATTLRGDFASGFRALTPLWLGVIPFGLAYAVLARDAGLSLLETQSLSILVFAGSAQVSAVGMFGTGAVRAMSLASACYRRVVKRERRGRCWELVRAA